MADRRKQKEKEEDVYGETAGEDNSGVRGGEESPRTRVLNFRVWFHRFQAEE